MIQYYYFCNMFNQSLWLLAFSGFDLDGGFQSRGFDSRGDFLRRIRCAGRTYSTTASTLGR